MKSGFKKRFLEQPSPAKEQIEQNMLSALVGLGQKEKFDIADKILSMLCEDMFVNPCERIIFKAVRDLLLSAKVTNATSIEAQAAAKYADEFLIPRRDMLVHCLLLDSNSTLHTQVEYYVDAIRDLYVQRLGVELAKDLNEMQSAPRDMYLEAVAKATTEMQTWGYGVFGESSARDDVMDFVKGIEDRIKSGQTDYDDYPTEFDEIRQNGGGWVKGNNLVISADTNIGKTTLGLNIVGYLADEMKQPGVIFSFEMLVKEIYSKLTARKAGIDWKKILRGQLNDQELSRIPDAINACKNIKVDKNLHLSPDEIIQRIRYYKETMGAQWFMIDYFQNVNYPDDDRDALKAMERFSRNLKTLSLTQEMFGVIISQVNDDGKLAACRRLGKDQDDVLSIKRGKTIYDRTLRFVKRRGASVDYDINLKYNGAYSLYLNP